MKIKLLVGAAAFGLTAWFVTTYHNDSQDFYISNYSPRVDKSAEEAKGMFEYLQSVRGTVNGFTSADIEQSIRKANELQSSRAGLGLEFTPMGPMNVGGRTRAIVVDNANPKRLYAASVSGGIFLSLNGGNSWSTSFDQKLADGTYYPWKQISCMAQSSDGTLFAGTGCAFESGETGGMGIGIYVSKDRGLTWTIPESSKRVIEPTVPAINNEFGRINDLAAHPTNAGIIAAATNKGLRLTNDGGITWVDNLICNTGGDALKSEAHTVDFSKDGDILYVGFSNGTFYKGSSYTLDCGFARMDSLNGVGGRNVLSTSPTNNLVCYAAMASSNGGDIVDIKTTKDGGLTWSSFDPPIPSGVSYYDIFGKSRNKDTGSGQAYYDFVLTATTDPDDASKDRLFVGGVQMWRFDGNWTLASFGGSSGAGQNPYSLHVDHHVVVEDKANPGIVYFGNDGGVWKSLNGGETFYDINKGYNTAQFYDIAIAKEDYVIGGTQDNGNLFITSFRPGNPDFGTGVINTGITNGDGFDAVISNITDVKYTSAQNGNLGRSRISSTTGSGACTPYCDRSSFRTRLAFWENENDILSQDSVLFVVDTTAQEIGLGTGLRSTFEDTIVHPQSAAKIIAGSIRIGTVQDQLVYNGNGGFTGNGSGTYDEATGIFKVVFNTPPALNARINAYYTANYEAGSVITVGSKTDKMPIKHALRTNLSPGDVLLVQDPIQSIIAMQTDYNCPYDTTAGVGIKNKCTDPGEVPDRGTGIIMSRRAIVFGEAPVWFRFPTGFVNTMTFSKDGNTLYYAEGGTIKRIKGMSGVYNQTQATRLLASGGSRVVWNGISATCTRIVPNPLNPDELLVTYGNWGNKQTVWLLTYNPGNDTWTPVDKTGNMKEIAMPVYGAIFEINDPKKAILATDLGVFSTSDITATEVQWAKEELGNFLVFDIVQQEFNHSKAANHEMIYLGTYGRGIYKSGTFVGQREYPEFADKETWKTSLKVYPNPVSDRVQVEYTISNPEKVYFDIIDMRGNIVRSLRPSGTGIGENTTSINVGDLPMGTYFLTLHSGNESKVAKIVKIR